MLVNGTGTQVLAGSNTYSGNTTVLSGTLVFSTAESMPSGTGVLDIEPNGQVVLGAIVDDGNDAVPAVTAAADIASSVASADSVMDSLLARLRGERAGESGHGSAVGAAGVVTAAVSPSPAVPEPGTLALLLAGAAGLAIAAWRRRKVAR